MMAASASSRRPSSANTFDWLFSDMARFGWVFTSAAFVACLWTAQRRFEQWAYERDKDL